MIIARRRFLAGLGGAAILWPPAARAQQGAMPVIGFLHSGAAAAQVERLKAFRQGLEESGFVEGRNVAIEYRWADGQDDRLPALAADLIQRKVAVIVAAGSTQAALAAKAATTAIPIVFGTAADPVEVGLVSALGHPGGNVTGATSLNSAIATKRLALARDLVPQATHYFALVDPTTPALAQPFIRELEAGAASLGIHVELLIASTDQEIDAAFARVPPQPGTVMICGTDAFYYLRRAEIAGAALRRGLPMIFDGPDYVAAGGLASYGADFMNVMQIDGSYAGRILKGEKPADLPVVRSTKFELVLNLKTAKALGIAVPPTVLALADRVIE